MLLSVVLCVSLFIRVYSAEECFEELTWTTANARILVNGQPLVLKGVQWQGFDYETFSPHGLDERPLDDILDTIKNNSFNAIQLPISMQLVNDNPYTKRIDCDLNPGLCGTTGIRMLDIFVHRAAERGLLIILSNKRFRSTGGIIPALWYDSEYSENQVTNLWKSLLKRYEKQWNVFAIDLKNQPNSVATWNNTNRMTDWNKAAERMINNLSSFNGLFFVDGIYGGVILAYAKQFPIDTGDATLNKRVVYTPHCYGPDVFERPQFEEVDFPKNLEPMYMIDFGFLVNKGHAVVIGHWGGRAEPGSRDAKWHDWFVEWLRRRCLTNNVYWSINPNEVKIGGLLDTDWATPIKYKLLHVNRAQPNPTTFRAQNGKICITPGVFPEPHCRVDVKATESPSLTTTTPSEASTPIAN